jgi:hypothetical protein
VKRFVQMCEPCQRTKIKCYRPGQLHPHEIIENPWEVISMDLIGPLPESNGYNAIQVWADMSTKAIHIEPTDMHVTAEGVAKLTRDRIIRYHGVPRKIISDRDPQYASEYMRELYKLLGVQANISTAYRPQTDGQTERANQEIEQYLQIFVDIHQKDWNEWLVLAEFSYNDKVNSSTKISPFFMNIGHHPWKGVETSYQSKNDMAQEFSDKMKKIREEATVALEKAQKTMTNYYNKRRRSSHDFKIGDKVYVEATNIKQDCPSKKLSDKQIGPYEIIEKIGEAAFKLKLPGQDLRYPVFNEELLTPYREPPLHRREERPKPDIIDDKPEYEVEEIIKHRNRGRGHQYWVKWKGYPHSENTWESESNLIPNARDALNNYKIKNNITIRSVPIFKKGHWDYLVKRYKTKQESISYPKQFLFDYKSGDFLPI